MPSFLLAAAAAISLVPSGGALELRVDTPWVLSDQPQTEKGGLAPALKLALRDLRRDWYAVFGLAPLVVGTYFPFEDWINQGRKPELAPPYPIPSAGAAGPFVFVGGLDMLGATLPPAALAKVVGSLGTAPESHGCFVLSKPFDCLVCTGVDDLGVVYSVYELSHLLGVDPQAFWTEHPPVPRAGVQIAEPPPTAAGLLGRVGGGSMSPTFEYRGFFVNDEDMLGGFAEDPLGESVFDVRMWDRVFELILRLKGNAVIVGTAAYPDERSLDLAARRGLYLAEHHITLLGTNTFQWPAGVPYSYNKTRETLTYAWRGVVEQQADRKMLWTVGYRGLNDYAFWEDDTSFTTKEAQGALISEAMVTQAEIVRNVTGQANPPMFTYLWSEMTELFTGGYLKIPPGVTVVHADAGDGVVNAESLGLTKAGDGLYFHIAVEGGKQLTETIPPRRIFDTIGKFVRKNATKIVIVNLSDIKPVPIGTAAAMAFLWDPTPFMAKPAAAAEHDFLAAWLGRQYGEAAAAALLPVVQGYFNMSYLVTSDNGHWLGEGDVASIARNLAAHLTDHLDPSQFAPGFPYPICDPTPCLLPVADAAAAATLGAGAPAVATIYAAAQTAAVSLPQNRSRFYASHTLTQLAIWYHTLAATANVSAAVTAVGVRDFEAAASAAAAGVRHVEALLAAERAGEGGSWAGWHLNDVLDGYASLRDVLRRLEQTAASKTAAGATTARVQTRQFRFGTGKWNSFFQYETVPVKHDGDAAFPFFYRQPFASFEHAVRFRCRGVCCADTVIGGDLNCSDATVVLAGIAPGPGEVIRYTVDRLGSGAPVPTAGSPAYTGPISLAGKCNPCSIAARSFSAAGKPLDPPTRATYNHTGGMDATH